MAVFQDLQVAWFKLELPVAHTGVALDYNNPLNKCEKAGVHYAKVSAASSVHLLHMAFLCRIAKPVTSCLQEAET